jgi:ubiquinone/menaquinone biosynthesis C-methylase UbiE
MHGAIEFGKRAEKYDAGIEGKFLKKFYDSMEQFVRLKSGDKLLDIGCGTGAILERFKNKEIQGYGVDIDERMLQIAREKLPNMKFLPCGCDAIPYDDECFDEITVNMAYHHFDNKEGFSKECLRTLKKNGNLYIAELRLPFFLRKTINFMLKRHQIVGRFFSTEELKRDFEFRGFIYNGSMKDGKVQIIRLKKSCI